MMRWGVMLSVVIGMVAISLEPVDVEVFLGDPILDPIEPHVHGFGPFDFGPSVSKPIRCGIVCCYSTNLPGSYPSP
jgi:hypothetical protein